MLKEKLGKKRILLNDDQRRRLAVKGEFWDGRCWRRSVACLRRTRSCVGIGRWWRRNGITPSGGNRLAVRPSLRKLSTWSCGWLRKTRRGATTVSKGCGQPGAPISDQTVGNILKEHGIEPAPERKRQTTWKTFLQSHWDVLAAIDFTTIEVWTKGGLITYYLLFEMEVATRRVHLAGHTPNPDEPWMKQVGRNLTDAEDGFLKGKRYVLMDRDGKFCPAFRDPEDRGRGGFASSAAIAEPHAAHRAVHAKHQAGMPSSLDLIRGKLPV